MANERLGKDIRLSGSYFEDGVGIAKTATGDLATIEDLENIRQALFTRLSTPIGDLWAHPEYGNAACDMVGDIMSQDFITRVLDAFRDCVNAEPRVKLIQIAADPYPEQRMIQFHISYQPLQDPRQDNFVYPYKVGDG